MYSIPTIRRGCVFPLLVLMSVLGLSGCGKDPTDPTPGGLVVLGMVAENAAPNAQILVFSGGRPVTDAVVTLNGASCLQDHPGDGAYSADDLDLTPGKVYTLHVTCSAGEKTFTATTPSDIVLLSPSDGATFADAQSIPMAWQPVSNATSIRVGLLGLSSLTPSHTLAGTAASFTLPASETSSAPDVAQDLSVSALNGQGAYLVDWILSMNPLATPPEGFYIEKGQHVHVYITD